MSLFDFLLQTVTSFLSLSLSAKLLFIGMIVTSDVLGLVIFDWMKYKLRKKDQ